MKRLLISLVLISLLATTTVMVAIAQEPTEEPTVEVTSTEEPTAEPTDTDGDGVPDDADQCPDTPEGTEVGEDGCPVEPTEEPTAEPTEEPTAEPTEEPTEEPTAEPTEEPTAEPTEEPTAEPTEEPTAEPTEEPTAEPTEEPTAEPTEEPTAEPVMGAQGDVGTQAVWKGSWTTQYIGIQNLGGSQANVALDLYAQGSGTISYTLPYIIPVQGNVVLSSLNIANGAYAGLVSSDEPVAAGAIHVNLTDQLGDSYLGFNAPTISQTIPIIFRGHSDWESTFYIQNASGSAQNITVDAYLIGSSVPSATVTYNNIPANSSTTVDFMSSAFDGFGSGPGAAGYAIVTGSSGPVAALCSNKTDWPGAVIEMNYRGLGTAEAAQDLVVPQYFVGASEWQSGLAVVNTSNVSTTVTMTYTVFGSGATYIRAQSLPGSSMTTFWLFGDPGIPKPSGGSVVVHASDPNAKILGVVNTVTYWRGLATGFNVVALNPGLATTKAAVPLAFNLGYPSNWTTGISVLPVSSGPITTTWVRANADPTLPGNSFTIAQTGTAGQLLGFFAPSLSGMLTNFTGAVYVESSVPILAAVNNTYYSYNISANMPAYNYE